MRLPRAKIARCGSQVGRRPVASAARASATSSARVSAASAACGAAAKEVDIASAAATASALGSDTPGAVGSTAMPGCAAELAEEDIPRAAWYCLQLSQGSTAPSPEAATSSEVARSVTAAVALPPSLLAAQPLQGLRRQPSDEQQELAPADNGDSGKLQARADQVAQAEKRMRREARDAKNTDRVLGLMMQKKKDKEDEEEWPLDEGNGRCDGCGRLTYDCEGIARTPVFMCAHCRKSRVPLMWALTKECIRLRDRRQGTRREPAIRGDRTQDGPEDAEEA